MAFYKMQDTKIEFGCAVYNSLRAIFEDTCVSNVLDFQLNFSNIQIKMPRRNVILRW